MKKNSRLAAASLGAALSFLAWTGFAAQAHAVTISIVNPGFDDNSGVGATGFDSSSSNVNGWRNAGSTPGGGVYASGSAQSSPNAARTAANASGAFQLTTYVLQQGDVVTLTYYATNGSGNTQASVRLLKTNAAYLGGGAEGSTQNDAYSATTVLANSNPTTSSTWTKYTLTYTAVAADGGKILGVAFDSATGGSPSYDTFALGVTHAFVHPGISHSLGDLNRMKNNVNVEPYKTAYQAFASNGASQYTNTGQGPYATVTYGQGMGQFEIRNDAQVAHQNAVMWYITGDTRFRDNAINIMNGWANTLQNFDQTDILTAGTCIKDFCNAGEIIRATGGGVWTATAITNFQNMLLVKILPALYGNSGTIGVGGFLQPAGFGGLQMKGFLSLGIFCDRPDLYSFGVISYQRRANTAYGLEEYIHSSGQNYENSRDVGHGAGNIGSFAENAYMAWNQGLDLFSLAGNLLAKAFESQAKFDLGWDVAPVAWTARDGSFHGKMSGDGRTTIDNLQSDLAYNIFHNIKGLNMPYTKMSSDTKYPNGTSEGGLYYLVDNTGKVPTKPLIGEPAETGVRLYEDYLSGSYITNFQPGTYNHAALLAGGAQANGSGAASSMRVPIGWTATLYDGDLSGSSIQVTGTLANQGIINLGDIGWNDRPYSMSVTGGGTWPIFPTTYKLVSRSSGKVADVTGASTADGANVLQYSYGNGLNELWRVESVGSGQFKLLNLNSGKALEVAGASLSNGGAAATDPGNIDQAAYVPAPNLATGGTALASTGNTGGEGSAQAFDGNVNTKWNSGVNGSTATLQYQLAAAKVVNQYTITSANDVQERDPSAWQFQGSINGTSWTTLNTQSGQVFPSRFQTITYNFTNTTAYTYYRLNITANYGGSSNSIQLAELGLYSSSGGGIHQRWTISPVSGAAYGTYQTLLNANSGKAMDVYGGSTADGVNIMQWSPNGGNNQQWLLQVP